MGEAIYITDFVMEITPKNNQDLAMRLNDLSDKLESQFERREGIKDLDSLFAEIGEYEYDPMQNENFMRPLQPLPGIRDEPLQCQLAFANINGSPSYEAISYACGETQTTRLRL